MGHGLSETSIECGLEEREDVNGKNDISNGDSSTNEVILSIQVGVQDLDGRLDCLDIFVVGISIRSGPSEGRIDDFSANRLDSRDGEVNPLVDLSALEGVSTIKMTFTLSGEVSSDGSTFNEVAFRGLEEGNLTSD
jgi:hypothetical protein